MSGDLFQELLNALYALNNPTWLDITNLIISILALTLIGFAFLQIRIMKSQAMQALNIHQELMKWNKSAIQNEMLYGTPGIDVESRIAAILKELGLKTYDPIPEETCEIIFNNPDMWIPIKYLLNHYETICVAISANVVDRELSYNLHSNRIVILWDQWGNLCKYVRKTLKDQETYWEIEKWSKQFSKEMERRACEEANERMKIEESIRQGKGMKEI